MEIKELVAKAEEFGCENPELYAKVTARLLDRINDQVELMKVYGDAEKYRVYAKNLECNLSDLKLSWIIDLIQWSYQRVVTVPEVDFERGYIYFKLSMKIDEMKRFIQKYQQK